MIKAQDLRIGNKLIYNNSSNLGYGARKVGVENLHVTVTDVLQDGINLMTGNLSRYKFEKLDGIPITPAILEKCGFERDLLYSESRRIKYGQSEQRIFEITHEPNADNPDEYVYRFYYKDNYATIAFLHQLQNIFYSLTGEELTCNL